MIKLTFPARDRDCRDGVSDEIGDTPAFAHETVNTKNKRHSCDGDRRDNRERGGERDKPRARDTGGALRRQHCDAEKQCLLAEAQIDAASLRDK